MGICIDFVSDVTITLAHMGEIGEHYVMEVLVFKNPLE